MSKLKRIRSVSGSGKIFAWAVARKPDDSEAGAREAERFLWKQHGVTIFEVDLKEFITKLQRLL